MAERTKLWIADKMKELMKKKPLDKIRITEICQAAEIERSTFYYHFRDKYELVAWIIFQSADKTDIIDLHDGAVGMTREWVLQDNMTSAETIVQMMFSSMPDSLRQIYFRKD